MSQKHLIWLIVVLDNQTVNLLVRKNVLAIPNNEDNC